MRLNEEQMEILRRVRAHFEISRVDFICIAIGVFGHSMVDITLSGRAREKEILRMRKVTDALEAEIQGALDGHSTMDAWLRVETGFDCEMKLGDTQPKKEVKFISTALFRQYMAMARMAWLDKILETGEIA